MKNLKVISLILVIVGGINWLLIGLFKYDLIAGLLGGQSGQKSKSSRAVYSLIGLGALYSLKLIPYATRKNELKPKTATTGHNKQPLTM